MADDLQTEIIDFLSRPQTHGISDAVETAETHISVIFLAGERVFKLKRAVKFPYLDFSTATLRQQACEAEVRINRLTAPDLYKGVRAVTREVDGSLALDGPGEAVDWLVEMARFDEETLFDRLAQRDGLDRHLMEVLADRIAGFHKTAKVHADGGGSGAVQTIAENNAQCFADYGRDIFDDATVGRLNHNTLAAVEEQAGLLDTRRSAGCVRRCHGDLHLRNIFLADGQPTLFDAIEFNDFFTFIDVLYDLAFLIMDLDHRGLRQQANIVFNRYLDVTGDGGGLGVIPLFLSLRAAIRAHVGAAASKAHSDPVQAAALTRDARAYLNSAVSYLSPPSPRLVAVGGLSGSGKSRLGRVLAPFLGGAPGARVLRSDTIRKRLAGVSPLKRLGQEGYSKEMTERTYDTLYEEVGNGVAAGHTVIADAVFARPGQRQRVADIARQADVPFDGLWLEAAPEIMAERVAKRRHNPSDATVEVLNQQLDYDLGEIDWTRIDSGGSRQATLEAGLQALQVKRAAN